MLTVIDDIPTMVKNKLDAYNSAPPLHNSSREMFWELDVFQITRQRGEDARTPYIQIRASLNFHPRLQPFLRKCLADRLKI